MAGQGALDFEGISAEAALMVERALKAAWALGQGADPHSKAAAATAFTEVERLALACAEPKLHMRVFETSGDFHFNQGACGIAEKMYDKALESARLLEVTSDEGIADVERLHFKITKIRNAQDPYFKNLERVAQRSHSYEQRNIAWANYQKDRGNSAELLAARGLGSEEYFRTCLGAAKWTPSDDEDEEPRW